MPSEEMFMIYVKYLRQLPDSAKSYFRGRIQEKKRKQ